MTMNGEKKKANGHRHRREPAAMPRNQNRTPSLARVRSAWKMSSRQLFFGFVKSLLW